MAIKQPLQDRFRGCILGAAIGDALGAPYEFSKAGVVKVNETGYEVGHFKTEAGAPTDDSTLLRFHAEAYLEADKDHSVDGLYVDKLIPWYESDPLDMGSQTRAAIAAHIAGLPVPDTHSCGNGSLMAVAPAGLMESNPFNAGDRGFNFSTNTHPNMLCRYVCGQFAAAIYYASRGYETWPKVDLPIGWMSIDGKEQGFVAISAGLAFRAVEWFSEEDDSFGGFQALKRVIEHGGDTDTNASIAGALIGARYGMQAWSEPRWLLDDLQDTKAWIYLADALFEKAPNR